MRKLADWELKRLSNPQEILCFTGPRPAKLPAAGSKNNASIINIQYRVRRALIEAVYSGKTVFLNGCMAGFDLICGETVLHLKQDYPHILCVTVAPFQKGFFLPRHWDADWKKRALALYAASDIAFALSEKYHPGVYFERDEYMIAHSSAVVCYYAGTGGGTKYTLDCAKARGLQIYNIA